MPQVRLYKEKKKLKKRSDRIAKCKPYLLILSRIKLKKKFLPSVPQGERNTVSKHRRNDKWQYLMEI